MLVALVFVCMVVRQGDVLCRGWLSLVDNEWEYELDLKGISGQL